MKVKFCEKTSIGELTIVADHLHIYKVNFGRTCDQMPSERTEVIGEAFKQIGEYLSGLRREFDLPLNAEGTIFQREVWSALLSIPYGEVWSYKMLAQAVGNPLACRAVGMANNRNPLPIIIPCHRVIGADGRLVGYAGGLDVKRYLLDVELFDKVCKR